MGTMDQMIKEQAEADRFDKQKMSNRKIKKFIWVRFQKEGIHCYPDAPEGVEFLKHPHRHQFHFEVEIEVFHDDRDIEFILFKRELEQVFEDGTLQLDYKSCEMLSDDLAEYIIDKYPGRNLKIIVSEDGENGSAASYKIK